MISQLLRLYENKIVTDRNSVLRPEKYLWLSAEGRNIGIEKASLSKKEHELLELFLNPVPKRDKLTSEQAFWHKLLIEGEEIKEAVDPFRMIHFHMADASVDHDAFFEAVQGLFSLAPFILWENENEGVLIEQNSSNDDEGNGYESLADTLTSDFYTDFHLYIGITNETPVMAAQQFLSEKHAFSVCRDTLKENVFYHTEQIPFLLLHYSQHAKRQQLVGQLLNHVEEDKELLKSIQLYLESNMNVSTAAKELFIHRNSLQYRVDKFVEKTNLDVKTFKQAVTVYLALLEKQL